MEGLQKEEDRKLRKDVRKISGNQVENEDGSIQQLSDRIEKENDPRRLEK